MPNEIQSLLDFMWKDYIQFNPESKRVYDLIKEHEQKELVNDHIALRTFRHPLLGLERLARIFTQMGYVEKGDYHFKEKKLYAKHYEHPEKHPKIFISELLTEEFSPFLQQETDKLARAIPPNQMMDPRFAASGIHWPIHWSVYEKLSEESQYAAWVYAFGFRPNHFTVSVNALEKLNNLSTLNAFLLQNHFKLNSSGGLIKGSPQELLEQSSTLAGTSPVRFSEGEKIIPACYYEFALRYSMPNGQLYQGFVAQSADKIFESTDRQNNK